MPKPEKDTRYVNCRRNARCPEFVMRSTNRNRLHRLIKPLIFGLWVLLFAPISTPLLIQLTLPVLTTDADTQPQSLTISLPFGVTPVQATGGLTITKHLNPTVVEQGQPLTYTLVVTNHTGVDLTNLLITDTVPANVACQSITAPIPWLTTNCQSNQVSWLLLDIPITGFGLPAGSQTAVAYTVRTDLPLADQQQIINQANTYGVSGYEQGTPANQFSDVGAADVIATVEAPLWQIAKTVSPNTTVTPGQTLTYRLTVTNAGTTSTSGLYTITDVVPIHTTVSSNPNNGTIDNGTISWLNSTLLSPQSAVTMEYTVQVTTPLTDGILITNAAYSVNGGQVLTDAVGTPVSVTVNASPALSLTKVAHATTVGPSERITYTLTYFNSGTDLSQGVVISDTLSPDTTLVDGTSFDHQQGRTYGWEIGSLSPAQTPQVITAVVVVPAILADAQQITNTATISDHNGNLETATAVVIADSKPTFAVTINDAPNPVLAGSTLVYTIDLTNTGTATATNLLLTDTLNLNTTLLTTTPTASGSGPNYGFSLGTLAPGNSATVVITTAVSPLTLHQSNLTNVVTLSSDQTTSATFQAETAVTAPAFSLSKSVSPTSLVRAGEWVTYTIQYQNNSPVVITNLRITDTLPVSLTEALNPLIIMAPDATIVSSSHPTLVFTRANLVNSSSLITIVGQVITQPWSTQPLPILNQVEATFTEIPTPITASVTVQGQSAAPAQVVSLVAQPNPAVINSPVTVTATLNDPYSNPVVDGETIAFSTTLGSLNPTTTLNGQAIGLLSATTPGTATVQISTLGVTGPSEIVTFVAATLAIEQTVDRLTAQRGDSLHYTVIVTNSGTTTATNVIVNAMLPLDVTFVEATTTSISSTPPSYSFRLSDIPVNMSHTLHLTTTVNGNVVDQTALVNQVQATSAETTTSPQTSITTTVQAPVLTVAVSGSPSNAIAGEAVTYTITYTSNGTLPVTHLRLTDTLPISLTNIVVDLGASNSVLDSLLLPTLIFSRSASFFGTESITITGQLSTTPWPAVALPLINQITTTMADIVGTITSQAVIMGSAGPPIQLTLAATPTTITAGGSTSLIATASDQYGNPIVNGQTITFTTDITDMVFTPGNSAVSNQGSASVSASSPGGGVAEFTAHLGHLNQTTVVTFSAPAVAINAGSSLSAGPTGSEIIFTIMVTNTGLTPLNEIWVQDFMGDGLQFVSSNPPPTTSAAPVYRYRFSSLEAGLAQTIIITSTITPGPNGLFMENTSSVTSTDLLTPQSIVNEIQRVEIELTLSKTASTSVIRAGEPITYTISYANNTHTAPLSATMAHLWLTDTLPSEIGQIYAVDAGDATLVGGTANLASGLVFSRNQLLPAETGLITIVAQVITAPWPASGQNFVNQVEAVTNLSPSGQSAQATIEGRPGPPAILGLSTNTASAQINAPVAVIATLTDQYGNPVYNDTPVDFGPYGQVSVQNGVAATTVSSAISGTISITAVAGTASDSLNVHFFTPPEVVSINAYLPLVLKAHQTANEVDLIIEAIEVVPLNPVVDSPVTISVTVKNQGAFTASRFWLDLYITNEAITPQVNQLWTEFGQLGVAWIVPELGGGQSVVLTNLHPNDYSNPSNCANYSSFTLVASNGCSWPNNSSQFNEGGLYYLTALVDSFDEDTQLGDGNIRELDEGNNLYTTPIPITVEGGRNTPPIQNAPTQLHQKIMPGQLRPPLTVE